MNRLTVAVALFVFTLSFSSVVFSGANEAAGVRQKEVNQEQMEAPDPDAAAPAQGEDEFDENLPIRIRDYFPGKEGSTWTYSNSCGGTLSAKIARTEKICNMDSLCLEAIESECPNLSKPKPPTTRPPQKTMPAPDKMYLAFNDSGLWMVRYVHSTGAYNSYCPPVKIMPAVVELGDRVDYAHEDTPCIQPDGESCGMLDGKGTYWFDEYEDITVPAGEFPHCLHIVREYEFETSNETRSRVNEEMWNAKGVGPVKRYIKEEGSSPI